MSDITEGFGAVIEGTLAGRAVEPETGGADTSDGEKGTCLNCGAQPQGNYCQNCGQKRHVHRSLSAIGHDLLHGVLHLDGKFWSTLPLLAFKPGRLTRRYIDGERAKFVSPMAMFLFSVFAMFAIFQMLGLTAPTDFDPASSVSETAEIARSKAEADRDDLRDRIAALAGDDPERIALEKELATLEDGLTGLEQVQKFNPGDGSGPSLNATGIKAFDEGLLQKWNTNPGLMLYKMQANAYKFSWLLIPLSIPFVWLLFAWKRRFKAYDHAIFVTYSLAFMSLLFIALSLAAAAGLAGGWVVALFAIIAPLHVYKHLKYTYDLGRFSTLWRFPVLMLFVLFVLILFLQALLVLGAF